MIRVLLLLLLSLVLTVVHAAELSTLSLQGSLSVQSWQALRDAQIVKQDFDYSCGAASIATILNYQYGVTVSEEEILQSVDKSNAASFADLARVLPQFGFKGLGIALNYEQLAKLKIPVVVYLQYRGNEHFSVLRGIDTEHVALADPSWGNRIFSKADFISMWHTREDKALPGKILLVLPQQPHEVSNFFAPPAPMSSLSHLLLRAVQSTSH